MHGDHIGGLMGADGHDVTAVCHGTTVATNALLEMKGGPIGVLVNRNMRGILEVQSQARDGCRFIAP